MSGTSLIIQWRELLMATSELTAADRAVGHALASFMNRHGECWPAVHTVAEKAGCCDRTARGALRKMERVGLIVIVPGGGRHRPNKYRINPATVAAFWAETRQITTQNPAAVAAEGAQEGAHNYIGANAPRKKGARSNERPQQHLTERKWTR